MGDPVKRVERRSRRTIFDAYLASARKNGANATALTDGDGKVFTYKEITRAAFALGGAMARMTKRGERVGVLLEFLGSERVVTASARNLMVVDPGGA